MQHERIANTQSLRFPASWFSCISYDLNVSHTISNHFSFSRVCQPTFHGVYVCCSLSGDSIYLLVGYINFITHIRYHRYHTSLITKQKSSLLCLNRLGPARSVPLSMFLVVLLHLFIVYITMTHELHGFSDFILYFLLSLLIFFFLSFSLLQFWWRRRRRWWWQQQQQRKNGDW